MDKTINITNIEDIAVGDVAYYRNVDRGFQVLMVNQHRTDSPLCVHSAAMGGPCWPDARNFTHARRVVSVKDQHGCPRWPDPMDGRLHIYQGADGRVYIYNPTDKNDMNSWVVENGYHWCSTEVMDRGYGSALPLTELELIPLNDEEQKNCKMNS